MNQLFKDLLEAFGLNSESCQIQALGQGHIHDTYLVDQCGEHHPPLILQKINNYVFKDINVLMRNMEILTQHIAFKNRKMGKDPAKSGILLLENEEGKSWIGNDEVGYWRMFWYIEDQVFYDVAIDESIAFEGGRIVAEFQKSLIDLNPELIGDTIPHFHDLRGRMDQFKLALETAGKDNIARAESLIQFTNENADIMLELFDYSESGDIPVRLTHNDTKFNNILYAKDGTATCMIDLDTVMRGYSWFDFGDALRTCASTAPEDEADLNKIGFRIEVFEGFARGYISQASAFLTREEILILHRAPALFAYMQGLRFLTDYLNGNLYYKIAFPEHNFQRARAQYALVQRMTEQQERMKQIISNAVSEFSDQSVI